MEYGNLLPKAALTMVKRGRRMHRTADQERGQVLPLFALAIVAIVAMVALVVEGGMVFGQQRIAQNGSDGAATAGALVVAEKLGKAPRTGSDVYQAVQSTAAANGLQNVAAVYTDDLGIPLVPAAPVIDAGAIPAAARGIRVGGDRISATSLARIIGITELKASAEATAIAGALGDGCPTSSNCALLPVTFPITTSICDGKGTFTGIGGPGDIWQEVAVDNRTAANEAIVPLCKIDPGSVGWLDLDPTKNLGQEITGPLSGPFPIPDWYQTQPGNVNAVQSELDMWINKPVLVPLFDGTCRVDPGDASTKDTCPTDKRGTDPSGNNTWYHVPYFVTFWLDRAYVQGSNVASCASAPGNPRVDPKSPGFLGCIKGWFVKYVYEGPVIPGKPIPDAGAIGIQLIR